MGDLMPEEDMQHALTVGGLGGTPGHVRAIECAYGAGFCHALREIMSELEGMHSSMSALDALTDLRQTYAPKLVIEADPT